MASAPSGEDSSRVLVFPLHPWNGCCRGDKKSTKLAKATGWCDDCARCHRHWLQPNAMEPPSVFQEELASRWFSDRYGGRAWNFAQRGCSWEITFMDRVFPIS